MSKSMWIDAVDSKPVRGNVMVNITVDVCFWVEGAYRPYWGHYDHQLNGWITKDQRGIASFIAANRVKYFADIDNPYK